MMSPARIKIGPLFVVAVVSVLLCGIVAGELPELLSLTDNTANDFTVHNPNTFAKIALSHGNGPARIAGTISNASVSTCFVSPARFAESAASPFTAALALRPVLRT